MTRTRVQTVSESAGSLTTEEAFEAYYLLKEAPCMQSTYEIAHTVLGGRFSAKTVGKAARELCEALALDDRLAKKYEGWKQSRRPENLYRILENGTIVSDFVGVQSVIDRTTDEGTRNLMRILKDANKFYWFVGRAPPEDWSVADLNRYMQTLRTTYQGEILRSIVLVAPHPRGAS